MMRAWGATLIEHGRDFDEARELVEAKCDDENLRYVHSANEPDLIAGVGTYALEIFEALADVDVVLVPIGGGSGACGLITVRDALGLKTRIIGVGAQNADAVARSWRTGTRVVGDVGQHVCRRRRHARDLRSDVRHPAARARRLHLAVGERSWPRASGLALDLTHNLAEGAGGAAARGGARASRLACAGTRVVLRHVGRQSATVGRLLCDPVACATDRVHLQS